MSEEYKPLKYLGFVENVAGYVTASAITADKVYRNVRARTPKFVEPYVARAEDLVSAYSAPAVAKAQDAGGRLLHLADQRVDYVVNKANYVVSTVYQAHSHNMEHFNTAKEQYFTYMVSLAEGVGQKLNPVKAYETAVDTFKSTIAKAQEISDPDVAIRTAAEAWGQFAQIPAVSKVLETAGPATSYGVQTFNYVHDVVVVNPQYKKAVELGAATVTWASTTYPAQLSKQILYPYLEPAYNKVSNSSYLKSVVEYWKPKLM